MHGVHGRLRVLSMLAACHARDMAEQAHSSTPSECTSSKFILWDLSFPNPYTSDAEFRQRTALHKVRARNA